MLKVHPQSGINGLVLALLTALTISVSSTRSTRLGQELSGTLIVLIPTKDGLVAVADRLGVSKTTDRSRNIDKLVSVKDQALICCVHAGTLLQTTNDRPTVIFSACNETKNFLDKQQINFSTELPAAVAWNLGQKLIESYDLALSNLGNKDELMKPFGKEGPVFEVFVINLVKAKSEYQLVRITVYAPTAKQRIEISQETIDRAAVLGMPETVEIYANSHRTSDVGQAIKSPSKTGSWSKAKALGVAIKMMQLTNKANPESVGKRVDGAFLNKNGNVNWKYKDVLI